MRYAFNDNICFTSGKLMRQLSEPVWKYFDLSAFSYVQHYPDGSKTILSTDAEPLYQEYRDQKFLFRPGIVRSKWSLVNTIPFDKSYYTFSSDIHAMIPELELKKDNLVWLQHLKKRSNIHDRFQIYRKSDTLLEAFHFCIGRPDFNSSFYHNHAADLEHFTHYFTSRAAPLIKKMRSSVLTEPWRDRTVYPRVGQVKNGDYKKQLAIKRYYIDEHYDRYVTKREYDCLTCLARGCTTKQVAQKLSISPRTVESYYTKMICQLGLQNKHQLIELFWNSRLSK